MLINAPFSCRRSSVCAERAFVLAMIAILSLAPYVLGDDGALDLTFGIGGKVFTDAGKFATGVALQADGKIVALGSGTACTLVRYLSDGTLDTTFGTEGKASASPFSICYGTPAIQPDSKIVVSGQDSSWHGVLYRFNIDGTLDSSFGVSGSVLLTALEIAQNLAIQPDGKIVVIGSGNGEAIIARCNGNGSIDDPFGELGYVTTKFSLPSGAYVIGASVAIDSDGRIVVGGYYDAGDFVLARYSSAGLLDSTFGTGGYVRTDFGYPWDLLTTVLIQPGGKIVAAGYAVIDASGSEAFALARYSSDGNLDSTFGAGGKVTTACPNDASLQDCGADYALIQADGRIIAIGQARTGSIYSGTLVRYNTDGTLDPTFGTGGIVTTQLGEAGYDSWFSGGALQQDGGIIAAGKAFDLSTGVPKSGFGLARYLGSPPGPSYSICLLYDPSKAVKSGATLPVKLRLCDADGANLSSPDIMLTVTGLTRVSDGSLTVIQDAGRANPDSTFRYDAELGGYIFNLNTKGLPPDTYRLSFAAGSDSAARTVEFQVK